MGHENNIQLGFPPAQGLYDPKQERDNCGVGFLCHLKGKKDEKITVARVLCSPRVPNTDKLGLDKAGVNVDDDGTIL